MSAFVDKGGYWVLAQNLIMVCALGAAPICHGRSWHWSLLATGAVLLIIGAAFGVAGVRALGRNLTPFPKPRADSQLVQSGVYRLVRHPLYSCLIFGTLGWALLWSSAATIAVAVLLAVVLDAKSRREERWLRGRYPEYESYAARVRRLIPGVY